MEPKKEQETYRAWSTESSVPEEKQKTATWNNDRGNASSSLIIIFDTECFRKYDDTKPTRILWAGAEVKDGGRERGGGGACTTGEEGKQNKKKDRHGVNGREGRGMQTHMVHLNNSPLHIHPRAASPVPSPSPHPHPHPTPAPSHRHTGPHPRGHPLGSEDSPHTHTHPFPGKENNELC
jgi:hypothetical protein